MPILIPPKSQSNPTDSEVLDSSTYLLIDKERKEEGNKEQVLDDKTINYNSKHSGKEQ
ncbi:MAG: hypothetical protein WBD99_06275 [Thermodesulfobacteriota bacterium]